MCFVVGKNYRLQDIQLSKIIRGNIAPRNPLLIAGRFPPATLSCARPAQPEPRLRDSHGEAKAGEYRARTGDLLVANQALSQLS